MLDPKDDICVQIDFHGIRVQYHRSRQPQCSSGFIRELAPSGRRSGLARRARRTFHDHLPTLLDLLSKLFHIMNENTWMKAGSGRYTESTKSSSHTMKHNRKESYFRSRRHDQQLFPFIMLGDAQYTETNKDRPPGKFSANGHALRNQPAS